jgi:hypothetical protein
VWALGLYPADLPQSQNPDFVDNVFDNRGVLWATRSQREDWKRLRLRRGSGAEPPWPAKKRAFACNLNFRNPRNYSQRCNLLASMVLSTASRRRS